MFDKAKPAPERERLLTDPVKLSKEALQPRQDKALEKGGKSK